MTRLQRLVASTVVAVTGLAALCPNAAQATTATGTLAISATVTTFCTIGTLPLGFGTYAAGNASTANSIITVLCNFGTPYTVGLNAGTTTGATITTRMMNNAGTHLNYGLYTDAGFTTNWGTATSVGTGTGLPQLLTVYGNVPSGQNVTNGSYTDTITATITY
jgi:spore coat protein U-like protein